MAVPAPSSETLISQMEQQLRNAEARVVQMEQEKAQMEADFEYKRTKIKELYYAKESTIREQNSKIFEASRQISHLESTNASLKEEIENIKMVASVSENTKQEAVEDLKKKHLDEIESLKCVWQDTFEEQRQDLIQQFDQERTHWETEKTKIEEETSKLNNLLSEAETNLQLKDTKLKDFMEQEIEVGMHKAQNEAENLKSFIVPLEKEIQTLKEKLKSSQEQLDFYKKEAGQINDKIQTETTGEKAKHRFPSSPKLKRPNGSAVSEHSDSSSLIDIDPTQPGLSIANSEDTISTLATELQDSISISSVSSVPEAKSSVNADIPSRVNSAPQLNQINNETSSNNVNDEESVDWSADMKKRHLQLVRIKETEIDKLQFENTKLREELNELALSYNKEKKNRSDLEESISNGSEELRKQISKIFNKIKDIEAKFEEEQMYRRNKEKEDNEKLMSIATDRDKVRGKLYSLKKEQGAMQASFDRCRNSLNKDSNTPNTIEGLKLCLEKYKEAYASMQVEKMHTETSFQTKISFLQSTLEAEKTAKEQMEAALTNDLEESRRKVLSLQGLQERLIKETNQNMELKVQVEKDQLSMESIRTKSREIIKSLKDKLHLETNQKGLLESKLADAKNQLRSLQESLETSEHVQRDFVKLSQSLQVQLEEIRLKQEASDPQPPAHSSPLSSNDQPG